MATLELLESPVRYDSPGPYEASYQSRRWLASSTRFAGAARGFLQGSDLPRCQEFSATGGDGGPRNSSGLGNHEGPSVAQGQRLGANVEPKAPPVQQRREPWISFSDRLSLHVPSIT